MSQGWDRTETRNSTQEFRVYPTEALQIEVWSGNRPPGLNKVRLSQTPIACGSKQEGQAQLNAQFLHPERPLNDMKCLGDVVVGNIVFRWFPEISVPMELKVTAVTANRIICRDWEFDRQTGAEIDEFLGWGPTRSGTYIRTTPFRPEFN